MEHPKWDSFFNASCILYAQLDRNCTKYTTFFSSHQVCTPFPFLDESANSNPSQQVEGTPKWFDENLVLGSGRTKLQAGKVWTGLDLIDPLGMYAIFFSSANFVAYKSPLQASNYVKFSHQMPSRFSSP